MGGEGKSPDSPSATMRKPITIVSARFEDLVSIGLQKLISEDTNLQLVENDVELEDLEEVLDRVRPSVVLLNFGSLPNAAWVYQLHQSHPETRIVVLANRPTPAEANQLMSFGATAAISKETQGRDIITAREAEVLQLLQEGLTNGEIAHHLSIGIETVRTHARNIYRKLGISTRRDLARLTRPENGAGAPAPTGPTGVV